MVRYLSLALILLIGVQALAQPLPTTKIYPPEGQLAAIFIAEKPSTWIAFGGNMMPTAIHVMDPGEDGSGKIAVLVGIPGVYGVIRFPAGGGQPEVIRHKLGAGVEPEPAPDPEPDPGPGPNPPPPGPGPIPAPGNRAILMYETAGRMSEAQEQISTSPAIREYLNRKCIKDIDGGPAYRLWDDDFTEPMMTRTPDWLRKGYLEAKTKKADNVPWVVASNGTKGISQQWPATEAEMLALLKSVMGE